MTKILDLDYLSVITELKIDRKTKTERFREHVWFIDQVIIKKKHGANSGLVNLVKIIIKKSHKHIQEKCSERNKRKRAHASERKFQSRARVADTTRPRVLIQNTNLDY